MKKIVLYIMLIGGIFIATGNWCLLTTIIGLALAIPAALIFTDDNPSEFKSGFLEVGTLSCD